ncbi:MAG: Gfo/Idh/MocA family oxidoreductase [Armatimonadetes bacterium]|nr:Gfo/Idh/MocA family oxidoreductase [Armatimonadota bacterium]
MTNTDPVRWGVLGCARVFERRMIPGFAAATGDATLLAVASRSAERAQTVAAKHGIPRAYDGYDALLSDTNIEVVYLPLPNDQHAEWTLRALASGKHVLCDKPVALSLTDAEAMASAANAAGLRLQEGFMYRHHPQHERVREVIASGEIGEPVHFRGAFTYTANLDAPNIRFNTEQGGGALLDVGVYPVNAARWFFGEPVAVTAASRLHPETGIDLHTTVLLEWADGRTGAVIGGFDQPFTTRYEIVGTKGGVTAERAFQVGETGVSFTVRVGDTERTESFAHTDQYGAEIAHFSRCVRGANRSLAPGENGAAQTRIVEAIRLSARENRRVAV